MKQFIALSFLLAAFLPSVNAKDLIVGVSPYWNDASQQQQFVEIMKFATALDVGDRVILIDAFRLKPLGEFAIPEGKAFQHPKARLNKNGAVVAALKELRQDPSGITSTDGAVRLPHFLRYVADHFSSVDEKVIVILGSPFFDDLREPTYSMISGFFPSDAHIVASIEQSLFGTKGLNSLLEGWDVHFAYGNSEMMSSRHDYYIERFLTLYVEGLGGELATFTADIPMTLKRAWDQVAPPPHSYELKPEKRLQMLRLRISDSQVPIHSRQLSTQFPSDAELRHAKNVQISAVWDCDCDIDLYARGAHHAELISFQTPNTAEGWYFKDVLGFDNTLSTYETIEFYQPVNLYDAQIGLVFYSGTSPHGVTGSLRLAIGDNTYAIPFHIEAKQGQNTKGVIASFANREATESHILMIDPLSIVRHRHE